MKSEIYTLRECYIPEAIDSQRILTLKDIKVGGLRLVYEITDITSNTKRLKVFLKPFKIFWEPQGKKACKKGEWGNNKTNLSNVWIKLSDIYEDFNKEIGIYNVQIFNPELIGKLNKKTKEFQIGKGKIPFKELIKYKISESFLILKLNLRKHFIN